MSEYRTYNFRVHETEANEGLLKILDAVIDEIKPEFLHKKE